MKPKITQFNPQNLKELEKALTEAVAKVSAEFGIPVTFKGSGTYNQTTGWSGKVQAVLSTAVIENKQNSINDSCIRMFDLPENVMSMVFTTQGKTFSIIGFNPKKPKNAVQLTGNMQCPVSTIKTLISGKKYTIDGKAPVTTPGLTLVSAPISVGVKHQFSIIASALSPENLYCDGELNETQAGKKRVALMNQWRALESQIGRRVSISEVESSSWAD